MTTALENFLLPTVELELAGTTYKLLFDFNAVAEVEERTGRNLMSAEGWANLNGSTISILLWACLQANHSEMTLRKVRALMNTRNLRIVNTRIQEAWTLHKAEAEVVPEGENANPQ